MNPSFLERQMDRLSTLHDQTILYIIPIPQPDEFGQVKLSYQDLKNLLKQRATLSYANGFFFGISCTLIDQKSKK